MSIVSGSIIDLCSTGQKYKNDLPGYLLSTAALLVDFVVARKLKVKTIISIIICNIDAICFATWTTFKSRIKKKLIVHFLDTGKRGTTDDEHTDRRKERDKKC